MVSYQYSTLIDLVFQICKKQIYYQNVLEIISTTNILFVPADYATNLILVKVIKQKNFHVSVSTRSLQANLYKSVYFQLVTDFNLRISNIHFTCFGCKVKPYGLRSSDVLCNDLRFFIAQTIILVFLHVQ